MDSQKKFESDMNENPNYGWEAIDIFSLIKKQKHDLGHKIGGVSLNKK